MDSQSEVGAKSKLGYGVACVSLTFVSERVLPWLPFPTSDPPRAGLKISTIECDHWITPGEENHEPAFMEIARKWKNDLGR